MENELFKSISKDKLYIGAQETYNNALAHYNVAQLASQNNHFGIANSLLILSVEECIKCMLLLAGYFNITIPFNVEPFFYDHKRKHKEAAEIQPIIEKLWKFKNLFVDIFRKRKSVFSFVLNVTLSSVLIAVGLKNVKLDDFSKWWKDANRLKNLGFYVGFESGNWTLPNEIIETTYQDTLAIAKPFIEFLEIVKHIRPEDYKILDFSDDNDLST